MARAKVEKIDSLKLVVKGAVPSKKNSRNIFVRNGKIINTPSKRYKEWHNSVALPLALQFKNCTVIDYPISINIVLYYGTKHRHDLDNALGSLMDLLVDVGILVDDDVNHVSQIAIQHGGQDKENPRAEIYLND